MKKRTMLLIILVIVCSLLLCSCATIISGTSQNILIDSTPQGVSFTIYNADNQIITSGQTPQMIRMNKTTISTTGKTNKGFNLVIYRAEGYMTEGAMLSLGDRGPETGVFPLNFNPWYWLNVTTLFLGGFIDDYTGATWNYPNIVHRQVNPENYTTDWWYE